MKNFIFALIFIIPMTIFADVEIHETFNNSYGFMGTKGTRTIYMKNNIQRVDEEYEMTGKFAMMMSKGKIMKSIQISDFNKKCIYNINPDKGVYSKIDMNDIGAIDSTYSKDSTNAKFEYEVKNMKESKVINGFKCNHYIALMRIIGEDNKDTLKIIDDMWVSKDVPGWKTIKDYGNNMKTAFLHNKNAQNKNLKYMSDFYKEISKIDGYAIKSDMGMYTSVSDEDKSDKNDNTQLSSLLGGKQDNENKSKYGYRVFHALAEVKSIEKKHLSGSLFKLKSEWKEIGN